MRTGGTGIRTENPNNNTRTPKRTAEFIAEYLSSHYDNIPGHMLDACAGDGVLGDAFMEKSICQSLFDIDINPGKENIIKGDVLSLKFDFDIIICNPPWPEKIAKEIYHHLYCLLNDGGVMFFLINNVFCYQGYDRAVELPFQKYYFLPRYAFKESGRPLLDCGVMVAHKGPVPATAANLSPFIPLKRITK